MNTKEVLRVVRDAVSNYTGCEKELYEALDAEAEEWRMRLQEIESEETDD